MNEEMPLGRETNYPDHYSPELLFGIKRSQPRAALNLGPVLPFHGTDIWNAWELTWLDTEGMPRCAIAEIRVPADSPGLIESKSLKLYLNSYSMTSFASAEDVAESLESDLSALTGSDVSVQLRPPSAAGDAKFDCLPGRCLDDARISCSATAVDPELLRADPNHLVSEDLHSHLLRSLCPVTAQPDSGSILVSYEGPRIDHAALLRYIVSYRQHADFHETCVERIFVDILERCRPGKLGVYARYQRRGGIDINPFRSNFESEVPNIRLWRQ